MMRSNSFTPLIYIFTHSLNPDPVTKGGDTILDLVISKGKLVTVKCLVTECSVDIYGEHSVLYLLVPLIYIFTHSLNPDPVTKGGDTILDLVISKGKLVTVKCLVTECSVDIYGEHSVLYLLVFISVVYGIYMHTYAQTRTGTCK